MEEIKNIGLVVVLVVSTICLASVVTTNISELEVAKKEIEKIDNEIELSKLKQQLLILKLSEGK